MTKKQKKTLKMIYNYNDIIINYNCPEDNFL